MHQVIKLSIGAALLALTWSACGGRGSDKPPLKSPFPDGTGGDGGSLAGPGSGPGSGVGGGDENIIPDPDAPCDQGQPVDAADPIDAARAMGLCKQSTGADDWGVVDAQWTSADGNPANTSSNYDLGHGVLNSFGAEILPLEGERLLVLSSGTAREPGDPDWQSPDGFEKGFASMPPAGFPKEAPACIGVITGETFDDVALEVTLQPPPGAEALAFNFNFFTYEWPDFVCSAFNDFFIALQTPFPSGQPDGNISFDSVGNPVSVNNVLVRVCECASGPPCPAPPSVPIFDYDCPEGSAELSGTGFETRAATGWLLTSSPVSPDELVQLRFTVYDSGDMILDSTTLLDNFRWRGEPIDDPETVPVPK